ncbi:MAG: hypothetical protein IPP31_02910 [Chitinophagaceae bacterium]|nr:hypothetical protein [Chitinophagaceae bacterium]
MKSIITNGIGCTQFCTTLYTQQINGKFSVSKNGGSQIKYQFLLFILLSILLLPFMAHGQQPKQTRSQEINTFIKKESLLMAKRASDWAKDKTGDILLDGVKEFIQKNKLDQNTAGKILSSVANNKGSLEQIYEGASSSDVQAAALSSQLLLGKIIAENVPESNMSGMLKTLTTYPDVAAEASQAMGSMAGGDYYKGAETIGKIIWKQTAMGKSIDKAITIEKAGWDFLTHNQFDAAYQKYKEYGSDGLVRMYGGPAAYIREKYFQGKSVSDEVINNKMVQLFEAARKDEAAAKAEQVKLERMYDFYKGMESQGGLIFDFRNHFEQYGISKEADLFDRFLWLNRAIRRDLISIGVDPWVLGSTLNSDHPTYSPEALALFMAFSQGGVAAYKAKFAEIARLHFPKKAQPVVTAPTANTAPGETYTAEKGAANAWAFIRVTMSNLGKFKSKDSPGWRNNGTEFIGYAAASGPVTIKIELTTLGGVSYFDYKAEVMVKASNVNLLVSDNPVISKDGGTKTYTASYDPSKTIGGVNIRVAVSGGNPEFFTYYVSGWIGSR